MGAKSAIGSPRPVRGMTALILGCGVLANRLFIWLDHAKYVIITKRLMAYAGPSSNGRTLVFGTSYVGSNPAGPAIYLRTKPPSGGFFVALQVYALISVRMRFILGGIRPIATIPNRKNVAIRSDFLFLDSWAGLRTVLGGGVPDRLLDYRRMLWFRIRVVPWLAHVLIDLACAPIREFALLFGAECGFSYSGALS